MQFIQDGKLTAKFTFSGCTFVCGQFYFLISFRKYWEITQHCSLEMTTIKGPIQLGSSVWLLLFPFFLFPNLVFSYRKRYRVMNLKPYNTQADLCAYRKKEVNVWSRKDRQQKKVPTFQNNLLMVYKQPWNFRWWYIEYFILLSSHFCYIKFMNLARAVHLTHRLSCDI